MSEGVLLVVVAAVATVTWGFIEIGYHSWRLAARMAWWKEEQQEQIAGNEKAPQEE